jgi:hypothetical protein
MTRNNISALLFILFSFSIIHSCAYSKKEANNSGKEESITSKDSLIQFDCRGKSMEINIPLSELRNINDDGYGEGYFQTFLFQDSQHLTIHCGSLVKLPFLKYEIFEGNNEYPRDSLVRRRGAKKSNSLCWREDNYIKMGFSIFYDNIPCDSTGKFENILNSLDFKP